MHEINVATKVWGGLPAQTAWRATEKATLKIDREGGLLSVRRQKPLLKLTAKVVNLTAGLSRCSSPHLDGEIHYAYSTVN